LRGLVERVVGLAAREQSDQRAVRVEHRRPARSVKGVRVENEVVQGVGARIEDARAEIDLERHTAGAADHDQRVIGL
jgi:hypothetical protein